jgi:hypothetical protein
MNRSLNLIDHHGSKSVKIYTPTQSVAIELIEVPIIFDWNLSRQLSSLGGIGVDTRVIATGHINN